MNINKTVRITTITLLVASMAACSTFRGPRPIDPNDDSQFENLPPAPAVESIPAPATVSESAPEAPETGSANLDNPIQGNVVADSTVISNDGSTSSGSMADLLKVRVYYFGTNLSDVTAIAYGSLNAHADYLMKNGGSHVQLSGHTDERGTREYNLALGERRANAVARYLVSRGVNPSQISVVSYGKEKPADDGHDEDAWSKNRRVELDYVNQ